MEVYPNGSSATALLLSTMGFGNETEFLRPQKLKNKNWEDTFDDLDKGTKSHQWYISQQDVVFASDESDLGTDDISPISGSFDIEQALPSPPPALALPLYNYSGHG